MAIDWTVTEIESFYELYKITYLTQAWYYTSADHPISYGGHTYTPAAIKRGEINKESELNKVQLDLTFPIVDFAKKYVVTAPVYRTLVTIYLYQDSSNVFVAFEGEVTQISLSENYTCTVTLDEYTAIDTKLPRLLISPACNHVLFDANCGLTKATWKVPVVVETILSSCSFESSTLGGYPDNYFMQGVAEFESDLRMVTSHIGVQAYLHSPFVDLEVGDTVNFYPGCDKSPEMCDDKFSNLTHYLGCPYVPRKNPVLFGL